MELIEMHADENSSDPSEAGNSKQASPIALFHCSFTLPACLPFCRGYVCLDTAPIEVALAIAYFAILIRSAFQHRNYFQVAPILEIIR